MTELNIPLLRHVVKWAEEQGVLPKNESHWDQSLGVHLSDHGWVLCLSGYVAQQSPHFERFYDFNTVLLNGERIDIDTAAEQMLGITAEQGDVLWHENITKDNIDEVVEWLIDAAI